MRQIATLFSLFSFISGVAFSWDSYAKLTNSTFKRTDGTPYTFDTAPPDTDILLYLTNDKIEEEEMFRIFRNSVLTGKRTKENTEIFLVCRETDTAVIERYTNLNDNLMEYEPEFDENTILLLNKEELDNKRLIQVKYGPPKPAIYFFFILDGDMRMLSCYGFNDFWSSYSKVNSTKADREEPQESRADMRRSLSLMDEGAFKERIWNYDRHSSWQYNHDRPAIVTIGTDWCGPCVALEETMEKIYAEYDDKIDFFLVDTEQEQKLSRNLLSGIESIPVILFCLPGKKPVAAVGALPEKDIIKFIEEKMLQ